MAIETKMYTITKKEARKRKKEATVYDQYDGNCERCGKEEKVYQDSDYMWVCNHCYLTRKDRVI